MSSSSFSSIEADSVQQSVLREARLGAWFGWISAAAWVLLGIDSIVRPVQDNRRDVFWWIPSFLMMLTIFCAHRVQRSKSLRLELYTFWIVMVAWSLVILGNFGLVFGIPSLLLLGFPGGAVVGAAGLIAFGVATWRAKVLPWFVGLALILWEPGSIAIGLLLAPISPLRDRGSYSAGLWKGFAIAIVAFGLQSVCRRWSQGKMR